MGIPLTDHVTLGVGLPPTRQVSIPVSFGARMRFWGALIQKGAAVEMEKVQNQIDKIWIWIFNLKFKFRMLFSCSTD